MNDEVIIHIPEVLADRIAASGLRVDMRDSLAVMTWLIASRSRAGEYSNLSHSLMGQYVRYQTISRLKKILREWRIIETDGVYSAGKKAFGYCISDDAIESDLIPYVITSRPCLKRLSEKPRQQLLPKTD